MFRRDFTHKLASQKLAEFRASKSKRQFGKEITNVERRSKNFSIFDIPTKPQSKPRSYSFQKVSEKAQMQSDSILEQYEHEIMSYMLKQESKCSFAIKNPEITERCRQELFDELVDVHNLFKLKEQTLMLTFLYVRDYLRGNFIEKEDLKLVGIVCLWIASKYEEIYPPKTKNFIRAAGNNRTLKDFRETEGKIMEYLNFNLIRTTSLELAEPLFKKSSSKFSSLCIYLLQAYELEGYYPNIPLSTIVTSTIKLANSILKTSNVATLLQNNSTPNQDQLYSCFKQQCMIFQNKNKFNLTALKNKFNTEQHHFVSKIKLQSK